MKHSPFAHLGKAGDKQVTLLGIDSVYSLWLNEMLRTFVVWIYCYF